MNDALWMTTFDVKRAERAAAAACAANSLKLRIDLMWAGGSVVYKSGAWAVQVLPPEVPKHEIEMQGRLANHFAANGVECVQLTQQLEQAVVDTEHGVVAFWTWQAHDDSLSLTTREKGSLVKRIHAISPEPWMPPANLFAKARQRLAAIVEQQLATPDELSLLTRSLDDATAVWAELADPLLANTVVHGDIQDANILIGERGPVLCDLENAGVGHAELDHVRPFIDVQKFGVNDSHIEEWFEGYGDTPSPALDVLAKARSVRTTIWCVAARPMGRHWIEESNRRIAFLADPTKAKPWKPMTVVSTRQYNSQ